MSVKEDCTERQVIEAQKVVIDELQKIIRELPTWDIVKERENTIAGLRVIIAQLSK